MSQFHTFEDLLAYCTTHGCSVAQAALQEEAAETGKSTETILAQMETVVAQMERTIQSGIGSDAPSLSGLSGGDAQRLMGYLGNTKNVLSPLSIRLLAYGVATLEENARMKTIVACPTAGGSGSVPAVLIALEHEHGLERTQTVQGLLAAGLVGEIVAKRMRLSGAAAGCQAEVGVASGMAAAGMVQALDGTPLQAITAAAISMQNLMGLVCDPVAGLVEVPCVLRNGLSAVQAVGAATMAMANIISFVPADEVVDAMAQVGKLMPSQLKETAEGGLAMTPTAQAFTDKLYPKAP
ncbi:MAG: L-serine ammonia-lyase, iron-sulfur-dependent, subunit alpha [Vampirovibrionales bacterium]|nr:L-serine ammonia-lyase, iron-sulfur-dependent, subunit alpha [Vampirovibrionales bacterium]